MKRLQISGPSSRLRSTQQKYLSYQASQKPGTGCVFCDESQIEVKETYNEFRLLRNRFPYETWDDHRVKDHLMLAPIRHSSHIQEFTEEEKIEYLDLIGTFEMDGYSVYSRAPVDVTRSVDHFHTHLLKVGPRPIAYMLYLRKPHLVWRQFMSNL